MVAEKVMARTFEEAIALRDAKKSNDGPVLKSTGGRLTRPEAAALFKVGTTTLSLAREIRKRGVPELVEAVERGDIPVNPAAQIAKLPPQEQRAAVASPRQHRFTNRNSPRAIAERIDRAVDSLANISETLAETMSNLNGDKRRPEWAQRLREVRTTITRFIAECER